MESDQNIYSYNKLLLLKHYVILLYFLLCKSWVKFGDNLLDWSDYAGLNKATFFLSFDSDSVENMWIMYIQMRKFRTCTGNITKILK